MSQSPSKRFLVVAAIALLAFGYGIASTRYRLFPHSLVDAALGRVSSWFEPEVEHPIGLWHQGSAAAPSGLSREIANLPYVGGLHPTQASGVTQNDPSSAHDGLNLVVSGHAPWVALCDMKGNVLHEWSRSFEEIWPGYVGHEDHRSHKTFWRRAHVEPGGELLAVFDGIGMVKLGRDSQLIWKNDGNYHHDMFIGEGGRIWTLSRHERTEHDRFEMKGPIKEDFICVLTSDGVEERRVSVMSCFLDSDYASTLNLCARKGDILHTNTIELMDGRFSSRHPLYAAGNALISMPAINTIAVVDLEREKVVWALGGMWVFQHQPTVLDNGNFLVFDNMGQAGESKVVEIDPLTQRVVWAYRDTAEHPLGSFFLGSCQPLKGGNVLITESTKGRALEVTRGEETVWEYFNPHRAGDADELIASLLEVVRIDASFFTADFAADLGGTTGTAAPLDLEGVEALKRRLQKKPSTGRGG